MTGLGKMERLRRERREELNVRLHHGQEGSPFKAQFPGLKLGGVRNAAGMPPQEPGLCPETKARLGRPDPNPNPQERELTDVAPGESQRGELAERSTRVNQAKSSQIKVNQGKSSLRGWGGREVASGQWLVASGWWRKRAAEHGLVKPSRTVKPVDPNQAESSQLGYPNDSTYHY